MADVLAVRDEYRLQEWVQLYKRCRESGLSNREFCRQNGIAEKTFYYWSGDGYVLIYKRLSNGCFRWARSTEELKSLDAQSFRWLMEGLKIEQPKAIRKVKQKLLF